MTQNAPDSAIPHGVVTLVFTDIEGSSELWECHRSAFEQVLETHNRLLRALIARHGGHEIRHQGDGFFLAFERASAAVRFALDAQRALGAQSWPVELRVRIGMHSGEARAIVHPGGAPDYTGASVNRAARVGAAARGGQILVSAATQLVAAPETGEATFRDLGQHRLKGVGFEQLWQVSAPDLPADFLPPQTLDALLHTLPAPATPLLGRESEIAQWRAQLQRPDVRLLTLTGFGGLGKTRAALQLAETFVGEFAGGVWWLELEEARSGPAMMELIALGLPSSANSDAEAATRVRAWARDRKALLVLDNLEQIPDAAPLLADLLRDCPHLKLLVTSRLELGVRAEHLVEVPPLAPNVAVALFCACVERGGGVAASDDADIIELCRRLEGVPLAIELAASRAVSLAPAELLERLHERFRLLRSRSPDLPPRQRALRATVDWSHDLLAPDERQLLSLLSVFGGGFTLEAAESVTSTEVEDAWESLDQLRRASLLRAATAVGKTRYSMLETVQQYASEKLAAQAAEFIGRARAAHARFYQELGRQAVAAMRGPREREALGQLETELSNLRAAFVWANRDAPVLGAQIALTLCIYFGRRGLIRQALDWDRSAWQALEQEAAAPEIVALQSALERERAGLLIELWDWDGARAACEAAQTLCERADDMSGLAHLDNLRGLLALRAPDADSEAARRHFERAGLGFERSGDAAGVALARHNRGLVEWQNGAPAAAHEQWTAALQLHLAHGDARGAAETRNNLGLLAQERGDYDDARQAYQQALQGETALGHAFGVARALANLGEVAALQQQPETACRLLVAAQILFDRCGSPYADYCREQFAGVAADLTQPFVAPPGLSSLPLEAIITWTAV